MPRVCFSVGPTGKRILFVIRCNHVVTILLVQGLLLMSHLCCFLQQCRPFGHDINSTFLNFAAGNSVLKIMSREWCPSLLVQAVLLTLCSAVPSRVCTCVCTHTHVLLQSCCSHVSLSISIKVLDKSDLQNEN